MADIALNTSNKVDIVESLEQNTGPAGANIVAGQAVMISPSNGRWVLATSARIYGIATRSVHTGEPLTVLRHGWMDGYALGGLAFDVDLFLNPATSNVADVAGTPSVKVGRVVAGYYNRLGRPHDKLFYVDIQNV